MTTTTGAYARKAQEVTFSTLLLLAAPLLPEVVHKFTSPNDFRIRGPIPYEAGGERYSQARKINILEHFAMNLLGEMQDLDPEIAHAIDENFWDLYEPI